MSDRRAEIFDATYADVMSIERTLLRARIEAPYELPDVERPYVYQAAMDLIAQDLVAVAKVGNEVVGVIMLGFWSWPWSRRYRTLVNLHFWVDPDHRKGGTAKKLLDWAKNRADDLRLPLRIDITYGGEERDLAKRNTFVKRSGFAETGGSFIYMPEGN